jgi:hypothetical protein
MGPLPRTSGVESGLKSKTAIRWMMGEAAIDSSAMSNRTHKTKLARQLKQIYHSRYSKSRLRTRLSTSTQFPHASSAQIVQSLSRHAKRAVKQWKVYENFYSKPPLTGMQQWRSKQLQKP